MSVQSYRDRLAAFFRDRPGEWVDGMRLAPIAGIYAWRSRCSDLRKLGMVIENRQRVERLHDANCPAWLAWDIPGACRCERLRRITISEYRYVPPPEAEQQTLPMETRA